jgi:transcriptional regulator with XRE-family HTH domain
MNQTGTDFMPLDRQIFRRRMADAVTDLIRQKHTTAKQAARAYGIDPSTAENLRKGHLSVPTLEKVARAEGWALWAELGREIFGQTYADHLQSIIEQEAHEQAQREAARDQFRRLERRAAELVALHHRPAA